MGWETHGSLQARRSHIRRAGAAHDERRSREHEHHGRQKAPTERGGNRTPSSRGEGAWVGRRHGSLQARRSHIPRADSKRPRSKDVLASCCAGDGAPRHKWVWSCGISWS